MIVSLLELQARGAASADVKEALLTVARRVRIQADAYRHLEIKARKASMLGHIYAKSATHWKKL
jgi:two-component sensor histidine kinase